jgi:hypothetical protein
VGTGCVVCSHSLSGGDPVHGQGLCWPLLCALAMGNSMSLLSVSSCAKCRSGARCAAMPVCDRCASCFLCCRCREKPHWHCPQLGTLISVLQVKQGAHASKVQQGDWRAGRKGGVNADVSVAADADNRGAAFSDVTVKAAENGENREHGELGATADWSKLQELALIKAIKAVGKDEPERCAVCSSVCLCRHGHASGVAVALPHAVLMPG